jgi:hypothetical protein
MGSGGSARRLRGELTEFAGWRAEPAPIRPVPGTARLATSACPHGPLAGIWSGPSPTSRDFPLARTIAVRGSVPGRTGQIADLEKDDLEKDRA